jgi:hypothetical protein
MTIRRKVIPLYRVAFLLGRSLYGIEAARHRSLCRESLKLPPVPCMVNPPAASNRLTMWLSALAVTVVIVAMAYAWIDRPLALFAHAELRNNTLFAELTKTAEWFALLALAIVAVIGLRALGGRPLSKFGAVALLCALSLMGAAQVKTFLKFAFGRTWPETWIGDNPSLIRDGVYGFHLFHGGRGYESFPSGHMHT